MSKNKKNSSQLLSIIYTYTHMRVQPQTGPQPRAMYSSLLYSHFLTGKEEALALSNEKK